MIPAPPPLVSKAPYVNTVHLKHGSKVNGVNSSRKSANVCAFNSFLSSKVISNSDSSIDHLVVLPFQSFGNGSIVLLMPLSRSRRGYNWSISPLPGRHWFPPLRWLGIGRGSPPPWIWTWRGGCDRMILSLLNASSHSNVHSKFSSFLRSLTKGRACCADLDINLLRDVNIPFDFMIRSFLYGGSISKMTLHLSRLASIPLSVR